MKPHITMSSLYIYKKCNYELTTSLSDSFDKITLQQSICNYDCPYFLSVHQFGNIGGQRLCPDRCVILQSNRNIKMFKSMK